ncbi:uncharacterized mitochondrial protein AtMg00810-like [Lycium ferocissimum]|uniref:uncharacterized mitochondrial protein AtMg00810-like n=1 Tax=Lycium ferocissimum TaxID=112874 RepID=UPI00281593CD|nr:uncharacterized mitochondrial protein AtMg00810-like [Lycium ferocissimum]
MKSAFLYGKLDKDIYMDQPPGKHFMDSRRPHEHGGKIAQYLYLCGYAASHSDPNLKLGELYHFLGLKVTNTSKGIFVTQEGYAKKLVDRFGVKQSKKCSTPLEASMRLKREEGSLLPDPKPFRALIGSLLYLTITRQILPFLLDMSAR